VTTVGLDDDVGTELGGELQRRPRAVDGDDTGRGHRPDELDGDVAEPTRPDHDGCRTGQKPRKRALRRAVGGETPVGQAGDRDRIGGR
jgi:hypothetical protein